MVIANGRIGRLLPAIALVAALLLPTLAQAATPAAPAPQDYRTAQFLQITLGETNLEAGLRLIDGLPDGMTDPVKSGGRRSMPNSVGPERYFYFDVHDSYIRGGFNKVIMTITYLDLGLTPIELEYDAYDVVNPTNMAPEWVKKRVLVANRTNSQGVRTARVVLEDARFDGNQPGGADFRILTTDDLTLRNLSLLRSYEPSNLPIRVTLAGQEVLFGDVLPFIDPASGRTLVPMRRMLNVAGVHDDDIKWDGAARTVTAKKGQTTILLTVDSAIALVNGQPVELDQPAIIKENRTLVPLRFVAEQLGLKVEKWEPQMRLIRLIHNTEATPATAP